MLIYIVMHYQPSNFWKPSDFVIQQSIFTVKITVPACEMKNMQTDFLISSLSSKIGSDLKSLDPRIPNINKQLFFVRTGYVTLGN